MNSAERGQKIVIYLAIFFIGLAAGFFVNNFKNPDEKNQPSSKSDSFEIREGELNLINPLLECEINNNLDFSELLPFKNNLQKLIDEKITAGTANHASVYFRDLNNGPWIGINEKEIFSPASLLKVPIMISYFKMAESNPSLLSQTITFDSNDSAGYSQDIMPAKKISRGNSYTVNDLVKYMIIYSDNAATNLLIADADKKEFYKPYKDLGLTLENAIGPDDFISVKNYASFFRILFNASYLSRDYSQKALEILSKTEFKNGLVAGVPAEITVAHKFGERTDLDDKDTVQMHDCGIIYYPSRPYLLCVMTKGQNIDKLSSLIADISKFVYKEVDNQNRR